MNYGKHPLNITGYIIYSLFKDNDRNRIIIYFLDRDYAMETSYNQTLYSKLVSIKIGGEESKTSVEPLYILTIVTFIVASIFISIVERKIEKRLKPYHPSNKRMLLIHNPQSIII